MGGLAAAARLATSGHSVTVCEQAPTVGGKLRSFTRDGFTFDTGPSLLTLPAVYRDLFSKTGPPLESVLDLEPVDPLCHYRFPDGVEMDAPNASPTRLARGFDDALGPGAGADWIRLLDRAHAMWMATRGPFLESSLEGLGDLVRQARRLDDLRTVAPWSTLRELGRRYLRDERLRMFLDRYATYAGSDPRRAPAALAVIPYVEQTFGGWYIRGGLRRLGDAVHERALARGAIVRTGADVAEVLVDGGRVSGVRLADGQRIAADIVVANADAAHVYADLVPPRHGRAPLRRLRQATPSLSGFALMLALRGRSSDLAHHTVLFGERYDDEFDAVFGRSPRPVPDPTVYVAGPDDPAMRPDDRHEALFVLVNAPRHRARRGDAPEDRQGVDWDAPGVRDEYAEELLATMAKRGLEVRDRLLWREVRTPADLERDTRAPGGAIYGTSSNGARAAFLRPGNRSPLPGLFLVGGSAHPGGGLPLVGLSAAIVARLIGPA
jgi:phytoene desaturase